MLKVCLVCREPFDARWRNAPPVCERCALAAVVCPDCGRVRVTSDPAQLALFALDVMERRGVWPALDVLLRNHFATRIPIVEPAPWPVPASRAELLNYPFH